MNRSRPPQTIHELTADLAHDAWPVIAPLLEPALDVHPFLDIDGLYRLAMAGMCQIIIVTDGGRIPVAMAMEVQQFPQGRTVANVLAFGAAPHSLKPYVPALMDHAMRWCQLHGCDTIAATGRPGWARFLQRKFGAEVMSLSLCWLPAVAGESSDAPSRTPMQRCGTRAD